MDFEELQKQIDELKAQGLKDEDILKIFYEAFAREEIDAEDLEKMAGALGYEFSEEFKQELAKEQSPEIPNGEGNNLSEEEFEDTKQLEEGESPEEFKEKIEDINENGEQSDSEDEDEGEDYDDEDEDEPEDEEDEEDKAMKMFGLRK